MSTDIGPWNDAVAELDAIVASFDDGEVTVDDLTTKLQRATAIIEALETRLTATQISVEELLPRVAKGTSDA
ncbi:MAG: exodeoxyribonuclease VII small subunit [Actinomycetota bacterium]